MNKLKKEIMVTIEIKMWQKQKKRERKKKIKDEKLLLQEKKLLNDLNNCAKELENGSISR